MHFRFLLTLLYASTICAARQSYLNLKEASGAPIDKKHETSCRETDQISLKEERWVILIERKWVEEEGT